MSNVSILTNLELNRVIQCSNRRFSNLNDTVFAIHDLNPITQESQIKLGNGIKNDILAITYLSHETYHSLISALFDKKTSEEFDNFYYLQDYDNEGIYHDCHALLKELFTIEGIELI
jgi:hypothetical protein